MSRTSSYYQLREALQQPGCALCRLEAAAVERFLDGLLYAQVNDPESRDRIRRARGFCPEHTWQLLRPGASLGIAILTHDVLSSLLKVLEAGEFEALPRLSMRRVQEALDRAQPTSATAALLAALAPQGECPACHQARSMRQVYLGTLLEDLLGSDGLLAHFEASDGLCLPHLRAALARITDPEVFEALLSAQRAIWRRLAEDLGEFIRKTDYRFRDEPRGVEGDAWLRAVAALAGSRPEIQR
jgi:hypothetical protein